MRVVIDTNVLVSRYFSARGAPAQVIAAWSQGRFQVVLSATVLAEYNAVLCRPEVLRATGRTAGDMERDLLELRAVGLLVLDIAPQARELRDPSDNPFLTCAVAGYADFVISGDKDLLSLGQFRGIPIVPPAAFIAILREPDS